VTITLNSIPTKSPPTKLPIPQPRPQTQSNGKYPFAPSIGIDSDPIHKNMIMGALQALQSCTPQAYQTIEQGGNKEEAAKQLEDLQDKFPEERAHELHKISEDHEKLIDVILEEEDQLIDSHKRHIDAVMELAKKVNIFGYMYRKWHCCRRCRSRGQILKST